ncbi:MmgE/PrpD family protein [Nitrospina watsonii]|uniref:2-methylcitrate dehydratase n=1 Tax=Nitrospina watsonii TaxID=1323948 RepID=A0ABN8W578_9BACT|nr:MmgE/PrpD family protein [Nitrospina watsonii]CAI2719335.1 2-methylcitrate dehydratase [Nitrospina watsonii]
MDRYEQQITQYVAGLTYNDLSDHAIACAKERWLDSLATAWAAYDAPAAQGMRGFATSATALPGATVLGTDHKAPMDYATLYLATLIRALDWNDTYLNREPAHPSDNLGAVLTVAEAEGRSGRDLLLATVLAYELHCRLCDAAALRKKGWDHVTYGSISSTVAAAKLLGLSPEQTRHALGIAITTGNYLRQTRIGTISQWKAAAFAQASQNAVRAALYVKHGLTGPSDIFEGQHGFIRQITQGEFDLAEQFGGQGRQEFKIVDTYIKYFPAEYHAQSAIWAALELREDMGPDNVANIERIHVETSFHSYEIIGKEPEKWHPQTKETADHSLPYIVAVALMDGDITLDQFDAVHLGDTALQALVQKVSVSENPHYTGIYGRSFPNKVTVTLKNGSIYEQEVVDPKGHPNNPLKPKELEKKFRDAAERWLSVDQQDRVVEMVWRLDEVEDLGLLMRSMVVS